jgi:hypothetical protein
MGDGGPPYPDVVFDYGKANTLVSQLDDLIKVLSQQQKDRQTNGQSLLPPGKGDWTGRYANEFSNDLKTQWNDIGTLMTTLQSLRNRVSAAITSAQQEQRRRQQANEQWQRQHPQPGVR